MNLNIDDYTHDELRNLLSLAPTCTVDAVDTARTNLEVQLTSNKVLGPEQKRQIVFFLDNAVQILKSSIANQGTANQGTANQGSWKEPNVQTHILGSQILIDNPNLQAGKNAKITEGREAYSGNTPSGYINPMNIRSTIQGVTIDSRFRKDYFGSSSTQFSVELPSSQQKCLSLQIANVDIPMTFYAISEEQGNNTFVIVDNSGYSTHSTNNRPNYTTAYGDGHLAWRVKIPDGNYEQSWIDTSKAQEIEIAVNNAIALATPGIVTKASDYSEFVEISTSEINYPVSNIDTGTKHASPYLNADIDLCFSIDKASGKGIFAAPLIIQSPGWTPILQSSGFSIRWGVSTNGSQDIDTALQLRLGWQLGFRIAQYNCGGKSTSPSAENTGSCVSEGIVLVTGPRYAYIAINDHKMNTGSTMIAAYSGSMLDNNIITQLSLSTAMDNDRAYKYSNDKSLSTKVNFQREYFGPVDINRLDITLYDEYGRVLNLNNMDWSFTLAFKKLYS